MDWKNQLEKKNPIHKIETVKIKVKLPHVNKKPLARMLIFVSTPFSYSTLKSDVAKLYAANDSAFFTSHLSVTKILVKSRCKIREHCQWAHKTAVSGQ